MRGFTSSFSIVIIPKYLYVNFATLYSTAKINYYILFLSLTPVARYERTQVSTSLSTDKQQATVWSTGYRISISK